MNNIKRVDWIDSAKGIGIWLVAVGHILSSSNETGNMERIIWTFHMPLFFYLSGLNARVATNGTLAYELKKSITSILYPYLAFSLISIALYATNNQSNISIISNQLLEMAFGVSGKEGWMSYNIPLWFFTCFFCVRMIFLIVSIWLKDPLFILGSSLILATTAHGLFTLSIPRLPWNIDVALCALVFYSAGHAWSNRRVLLGSMPWMPNIIICLIFAAIVYIVSIRNGRVDMNGRHFNNPLLFYIGAFSGIVVIVFISRILSKISWLKSIGLASIVIFPMHGLLHYFLPGRTFSILNWYAYQLTGSATISAMVLGAVQVALCMPVFWLVIRYAPILIGRTRSKVAIPLAWNA